MIGLTSQLDQKTVTCKAFSTSKRELQAKRRAMIDAGIPCGTIRSAYGGFRYLHWHSGPKVNYA